MKYYLAPMEGITGYIYRNAYEKYYGGIDKYFTPFIVPTQSKRFSSREKQDILPEHNQGLPIVPQILTNDAQGFVATALFLKELGYEEVNLNLGCPSSTVVSKGRGAGFLAKPKELNQFLEQIYTKLDLKISIKTRLGKESGEEFYNLLDIYNQYPLEELIIHPRLRSDFYKNHPDYQLFAYGMEFSKAKVCYNGDIFNQKDYDRLRKGYPDLKTVMFGRGILANPGFIQKIEKNNQMEKKKLKEFHDEVCYNYQQVLSGDRNVLFKMKELWIYMIHMFSDHGYYLKKIRKSQSLVDYEAIVSRLFQERDLLSDSSYPKIEKEK